MRKCLGRIGVLCGTLVLAILGFFLRKHQLVAAFDPMGLPTGQGVWGLVIVCVLALAAFLAVSLQKQSRPGSADNFPPSRTMVILSVLAAGLLIAGNVTALTAEIPMATPVNQMMTRFTAILGIVSGLCFVGAAAGQYKEKKPSSALYLLPVVYYILQMIFNFKGWSTDPIILDYCFKLFSLIFVMLAVFHVSGFAFGSGRCRITLFLCLCGVFFSVVALADGGAAHVQQTAGSMLWLLANAWQLLGEKTKSSQ